MVAPSSNAGPRYAPPDPTLPPPWRALVDGNTGYVYYWNTETNVTQYEKPAPPPQVPSQAPPLPTGPPPMNSGPKLAPIPLVASSSSSSSSQVKSLQHDGNINGQVNNANGNFVPSKMGMPVQPNLAAIAIPRGQQSAGGFSASRSTGGGLNGPNYGPEAPGTGMGGNFKSSADHHEYSNREAYKRPRTQVYHEPLMVPDFETYRKQHELTVLGDNVPPPFITFDAAGFPAPILRELLAAGFTSPTPIQAQSWPVALQSRDIVAIAKTGSGKTLGYMLPAFLKLERQRNNSQLGPTVLVLSPTRELATQIQDEATKFGRSSRITSMCVYGGAPKGPQLREIERGADIVIATPGRLNDFLEMKKVSLKQVSYLVLDEADRMLDMGFEPQIRKIVAEIPARRQTLMYTATWPKEVRRIAADLLVNAVQVNVGNSDELSANKSITQHIEVLLPHEKQRRLEQILRTQDPGSKIIIFCSTKRMCDQLARGLGREFGAAAIHGDKSQTDRDWVLAQFKSGKTPILVATDVAARGLDIKDIRVVINYDFPTGVEDYVHRIGRTGRAGATGVAHTFFLEQDSKYAGELIKVLEGANQKVPVQLRDFASRGGFMRGRGGRWDSGGRGRDASRGGYGGRGDGYGGRGDGYAGRGDGNGGRGDGYGGRGDGYSGRSDVFAGRGARSSGNRGGRFGNWDRQNDRVDRDRFGNRDYQRPRLFDERDKGRDDGRRYGERDRGRSFSRSYSRSPSRSRGRSFSRSRSRSGDKYAMDRRKEQSGSPLRSPYVSTYRSKSPVRGRSPYLRDSPPRDRPPHHSAPFHSSPPHVFRPSPQVRSPHRTSHPSSSPIPDRSPYRAALPHSSLSRDRSPHRVGNPRSPTVLGSFPYRAPHPHSSPPRDKSPYNAASLRSPHNDSSRHLAASHSSPSHNRALSPAILPDGLSHRAGVLSRSSPPRDKSPYRLNGYSRSSPPHDRVPCRASASSCLSQLHDEYAILPDRSSPLHKSPCVPSRPSPPHNSSPYRADPFAPPPYDGTLFQATAPHDFLPPYSENGGHA